jgi:hypothetical protein
MSLRTGIWTIALGVLVVISSLLAGIYIDLIVHKVTSRSEILDAFGVHLDFARSEKWQGYFVDQETTGEWKVHAEAVDLTSFVHSNPVIGTATDPENLPSWDLTGYTKSDSEYLVNSGEDIGIGFYLLTAHSGIKTKPTFANTFFAGYRFGKNDEHFLKCPYVLIRENDIHTFQITKEDLKDFLLPMSCDNLSFPALLPQGALGELPGIKPAS